ncbi:hypothetical protein MRB53_038535 [Persea americana]|nr:hypothetical protein MRB53_038535 [Persea americana]
MWISSVLVIACRLQSGVRRSGEFDVCHCAKHCARLSSFFVRLPKLPFKVLQPRIKIRRRVVQPCSCLAYLYDRHSLNAGKA